MKIQNTYKRKFLDLLDRNKEFLKITAFDNGDLSIEQIKNNSEFFIDEFENNVLAYSDIKNRNNYITEVKLQINSLIEYYQQVEDRILNVHFIIKFLININTRIVQTEAIVMQSKDITIQLPDMFSDKNKLELMCKLLAKHEFVFKNLEGKYIWQGKPIPDEKKIQTADKLQLVALHWKIYDKLYNKKYKAPKLYKAYSEYFSINIEASKIFEDGEKSKAEKYINLYKFLDSILTS